MDVLKLIERCNELLWLKCTRQITEDEFCYINSVIKLTESYIELHNRLTAIRMKELDNETNEEGNQGSNQAN